MDTLRADHLGAYGYPFPTSPTIDELAEEALVFEAAIATCPATAPSIASILTGHHRATHGVVRNGAVLREGVATLTESLQAAGYRTVGVVANPALIEDLGFGQGFDTFGTPEAIVTGGPGRFGGEPVVAEALAEIDALQPGPFFLWVHFMDPHGAYFPPENQRALFDPTDYAQPGDVSLPLLKANHGLAAIPRYQRLTGQQTGELIDPGELRARYDPEIHYVDEHIGALIDGLRDRHLWDDSLFVLTADHGESLGEHNYYFQHGFFPYEDTLRVPLLIRFNRRLGDAQRITETISLLDLNPTILDLAGQPGLGETEGKSAVSIIEDRAADRSAFAVTYYGNRLVTLRHGNMKYVYKPPPRQNMKIGVRATAGRNSGPFAKAKSSMISQTIRAKSTDWNESVRMSPDTIERRFGCGCLIKRSMEKDGRIVKRETSSIGSFDLSSKCSGTSTSESARLARSSLIQA